MNTEGVIGRIEEMRDEVVEVQNSIDVIDSDLADHARAHLLKAWIELSRARSSIKRYEEEQ